MTAYMTCFNSLQTGKGVQTQESSSTVDRHLKFQFPSNGKGCSDRDGEPVTLIVTEERFNSLQTGKGVQTAPGTFLSQNETSWSFNSLQTGKGVQTALEIYGEALKQGVSIPFKRERVFRLSHQLHSSTTAATNSFNSLQTGKGVQTSPIFQSRVGTMKVSIPFKRERVFRLWPSGHRTNGKLARVSIPFKRERVFRR